MREICLSPQSATAVCFLNGLDILVALQTRLCVIEATKFLTKAWIDYTGIAYASFEDDIIETSSSYDDNSK